MHDERIRSKQLNDKIAEMDGLKKEITAKKCEILLLKQFKSDSEKQTNDFKNEKSQLVLDLSSAKENLKVYDAKIASYKSTISKLKSEIESITNTRSKEKSMQEADFQEKLKKKFRAKL